MKIDNRSLDQVRAHSSELENNCIDEYVAGHLSRRDFIRHGGVLGMSITAMGAVLAACGNANSSGGSSSSSGAAAPAKAGGTLKIATQVPAAAINPLTIADNGGLTMLCQAGDFLIRDNTGYPGPTLIPKLATSWKPNSDGTVWTFKLRQGVKFSDGSPMTADDVVYTFQQQSNPKNAANALSVFGALLDPSGVQKVDDHTVAFHLQAADGNFPYQLSADNYNCIIVKKGQDFASFQKDMIGTGPWKLKSYVQNVSASFEPNPYYWGAKPKLAATAFQFYQSQAPQILALQGGQVDVVDAFIVAGASALLHNPQYQIFDVKATLHRELSMRCDKPPFNDSRVRQAVALSLDRPGLIKALLGGYGSLGNDSVFAPVYASTDKSVPQRAQDIAKAKQLLSAAGHPNGFSATLFSEQYQEIPQLAQAIAASCKQIGINVTLKVETQNAYYGKATFGNSDWLDGEMSLVDYGGRGVPNTVLQATTTSKGVWNAAHFKNPQMDKLYKEYVKSIDVSTQMKIAGQIQTLLLNETPIIIPYFEDALNAGKPNVHNIKTGQIQQLFVDQAYLS
ncbi:MAG: ABC transporter substrate-binding protein [Solirubrobacteraceae bacterium]